MFLVLYLFAAGLTVVSDEFLSRGHRYLLLFLLLILFADSHDVVIFIAVKTLLVIDDLLGRSSTRISRPPPFQLIFRGRSFPFPRKFCQERSMQCKE